MASPSRIVITGTGAICAAGRSPEAILEALRAGRSALGPIRSWDASQWETRCAAEIADLDLRSLVTDRKQLKLIRRGDVLGINAASQALAASGLTAWRDGLAEEVQPAVNDRVGVYVGSGGGTFDAQYDYFPLFDEAHGDMGAFGRELDANVNPMWLLRTLPNNVLCHVGINHSLKGSNACITNHSTSGTLAILEAREALRTGEADRAVAVGHEAPVEPQFVLYYQRAGLAARDTLRPFDVARDGSLFGEGAGALVLETESAAAERGATVLGEVLGGGAASEAQGLLSIQADGEGLAAAIRHALDDAGVAAAAVGMIVAHANGTRVSDASEVTALRRVFGTRIPPVTGTKWAIGHLLAAAGAVDAVVAVHALRGGTVPGIASLETLDPEFGGFPVSREATEPTSDVALILSRGFGATNAALLVRAPRA